MLTAIDYSQILNELKIQIQQIFENLINFANGVLYAERLPCLQF